MPRKTPVFNSGLLDAVKKGEVIVSPTDTIYGVLGSALNPKTVSSVYRLRHRELTKPFIVLLGDVLDLELFGIRLSPLRKKILSKVWPGPVSVILPVKDLKWKYLHRGTESLAFRLPKPIWLRKFLRAVGPLVAPSANLAGLTPASGMSQAKKYFGKKVKYYVDGGTLTGQASTLISLLGRRPKILRPGSGKLDFLLNK